MCNEEIWTSGSKSGYNVFFQEAKNGNPGVLAKETHHAAKNVFCTALISGRREASLSRKAGLPALPKMKITLRPATIHLARKGVAGFRVSLKCKRHLV